MQTPLQGAAIEAAEAGQFKAIAELASGPEAVPAEPVSALVVRVAPQKLPSEIAWRKRQHVVVRARGRGPRRPNVVPGVRHGTAK